MASKRTPVKKSKARAKVAKKAPTRASKSNAKVTAAKKATATRGAAAKAKETAKFSRTASRVYGKNSQTTKRLKELTASARRWELEARKSKTLSGKQKARAKASKARDAAAHVFKSATREATHGQARQRGWKEVSNPDRSRLQQADTFTSYEHARHGAGSLLSLLESRPGVVGILGWRRVSQIESVSPGGLTKGGELRPQLAERADDMVKQLGLTGEDRADFYAMLQDAELYGVEVELEIENYSDEGAA